MGTTIITTTTMLWPSMASPTSLLPLLLILYPLDPRPLILHLPVVSFPLVYSRGSICVVAHVEVVVLVCLYLLFCCSVFALGIRVCHWLHWRRGVIAVCFVSAAFVHIVVLEKPNTMCERH